MNDHRTFAAMLRQRAFVHPSRSAVVFIDGAGDEQELSYGHLWQRCLDVATALAGVPPVAQRQSDLSLSEFDPLPPAASSPRALLLFPAGIDFLPAFIGAQLAGWIPVPTGYPKPHRAMPRLDATARDCRPAVILSDSQTLHTLDRSKLDPAAADLPCIAIDAIAPPGVQPALSAGGAPPLTSDSAAFLQYTSGSTASSAGGTTPLTSDSVAFLQYTSGSTSEPKGVIISHRNLMTNLEMIRTSFALDWQSDDDAEPTTAVFWLPHYHDMGLVGGMLAPLYIGFRTVLMSPQTFVRRPLRWLQTIDRFRAAVTGAPSFAFELCADRISPQHAAELDLTSLRVTFCGAEPIRAAALRAFATRFAGAGFKSHSYYPCYGLAESTLLVSGGKGPSLPGSLELDRLALREGRVRVLAADSPEKGTTLVSCGSAAGDTELVVVDPDTRLASGDGRIGEIWIRGDSVSSGYWNRPQENSSRFGACLAARRPGLAARLFGNRRDASADSERPAPPTSGSQERPWSNGSHQKIRGFFRTGDLGFIHGGELFITGRLKDVIIIRGRNYFPQDIEATVAQIGDASFGRVAALAVQHPRGEALAVVAEVARHTPPSRLSAITRLIRRAIIEEHEIDPRQVLLVRPSMIPVTTSGKLRRSLCRQWLDDDFRGALHRWQRSGGTESPPLPLPPLPDNPGPLEHDAINDMVRLWIVQWLTVRGGIEPDQIEVNQRFEDYGLDSLMAIELIGDLEDCCDVELTPSVAWEHPSIDTMASLIAARLCGVANDAAQRTPAAPSCQTH